MGVLDFGSLIAAVEALQKAVDARAEYETTLSEDGRDTMRSGVIQNFEVAYEQSWKMIKRWLETHISPDVADGVTRRELYRQAAEQKLIDDVELWMDFHQARNQVAHTYGAETARQVCAFAERFLPVAKTLIAALQARND